jgi:hypothetical protein
MRRHPRLAVPAFVPGLAAAGCLLLAAPVGRAESGRALAPEKALRKASVGGRYAMLLRQIPVPQDREKESDFREAGRREVKEYAGFTDLPAGYWVYVYPCWYVWRDLTAQPKPAPRAWGPEQATGPPDTPGAGDIQTAWASLTQDDQDEWLLLEYAEPVVPEAVLVHETYNPGALYRVTLFKLTGEEVEVWKGKDPTPVNSGRGVSEVKFRIRFKTNRVKIYLASKDVPGWNEIDAVGLRDTTGKTHWAARAEASSTYAQLAGGMPAAPVRIILRPAPAAVPLPLLPPMPAAPAPPMPLPAPNPGKPAPLPPGPAAPGAGPRMPGQVRTNEDRIRKLEDEVRELKQAVKELKEQLKQQAP